MVCCTSMTRVQRTELSKIEQTRLYPRLTNPNFLVLRARRLIFERWIKSVPGTSLRVLDIGGRYQPYRPLFGNRIKSYIACDILSTGLVDVVARGESLPFAENTFDVVISTQDSSILGSPSKHRRRFIGCSSRMGYCS